MTMMGFETPMTIINLTEVAKEAGISVEEVQRKIYRIAKALLRDLETST